MNRLFVKGKYPFVPGRMSGRLWAEGLTGENLSHNYCSDWEEAGPGF
jgi:hypothetical protein